MKEHNYRFVQPVSMQVNQEQFDCLKPKLEAMGYVYRDDARTSNRLVIATNFVGNFLHFSLIEGQLKDRHYRHFIDHYNPELFLAIAAMTDAEFGIAGEHWVCINADNTNRFTVGKIYVATNPINGAAFIDDKGDKNGWSGTNLQHFRRATLPELISHYTKPKKDMSTETRNVQLSLEQAKALYEKDKEQYAWLLPTFPELEKPKKITWEGLGQVKGYFTGDFSIVKYANQVSLDANKNIYRTEAQARGALAQSMITQLLPVYNGDWVADSLLRHEKYCIILRENNWKIAGWVTDIATILNFKDRATAERFLAEQSELLEQYKGLFIEPKKD